MSLKEIDRRVIIWHIDEEEPNSDVRSFFLWTKCNSLHFFNIIKHTIYRKYAENLLYLQHLTYLTVTILNVILIF